MPSLLDVAPPEITAEEIDIRGTKLKVTGLSADVWAALYARHPAMKALVAGGRRALESVNDIPVLLASQAALIAAATGHLGDSEIEHAVLERLTSDDQRLIVAKVMELSLPGHMLLPLMASGETVRPLASPQLVAPAADGEDGDAPLMQVVATR